MDGKIGRTGQNGAENGAAVRRSGKRNGRNSHTAQQPDSDGKKPAAPASATKRKRETPNSSAENRDVRGHGNENQHVNGNKRHKVRHDASTPRQDTKTPQSAAATMGYAKARAKARQHIDNAPTSAGPAKVRLEYDEPDGRNASLGNKTQKKASKRSRNVHEERGPEFKEPEAKKARAAFYGGAVAAAKGKKQSAEAQMEDTDSSARRTTDGNTQATENRQEKQQHQQRRPGQLRPRAPLPPDSTSHTALLVPPQADDAVLRKEFDIVPVAVKENSIIRIVVGRVMALLHEKKPGEDAKSGGEAAESKTELGQHEKENQSAQRESIVAVLARGPAANKAITVAEIAKRELLKSDAGAAVWQYTGCWSRMETLLPERVRAQTSNEDAETAKDDEPRVNRGQGIQDDGAVREENEDEEEHAFETMQLPERRRVRAIPCLVIYLTRRPVPRLKELLGEQKISA